MREAFPSLLFDTIEEYKEKDTIISRDGSEAGTTSTQQNIIIGYNVDTSSTTVNTTLAATSSHEYASSNSNGSAGTTFVHHHQQQHHQQQSIQQQQSDGSAPNSADDKNNSTVSALLSHLPFPGELEELRNILHFPEEVALRLTDSEYQLFNQVRNKNS